jgi:hypothetical protein
MSKKSKVKETKISDTTELNETDLRKIFAGYDSWVPTIDRETMKNILIKVGSRESKKS